MSETLKFDVNTFDRKVGNIIARFENKRLQNIDQCRYNEWINEYLIHLENIYDLSNLDIDFEDFCNYIYINSSDANGNLK